jgi:hypothetical protein
MRPLRRGFGCFYAGKVLAQVLQKLMRHSDIRITMACYANVDDAAERAVRERGRECNSSRNSVAGEGAMPDARRGATCSSDETLEDSNF